MATMGVTFGPWYPLERAVAEAPGRPSVLQVRAEALLSFPRGKSPMVLYTATAVDEPLVAFVAGRGATRWLARAAAGAWCASPRRSSNGSCSSSRNGSAPRHQATRRNDPRCQLYRNVCLAGVPW
jgi:hypothetical protein